MFIKTSNTSFQDFDDIIYNDLDFSSSNKINLNNKSIDNLKLVCDDNTFIKVTDGIDIKSFIVNRMLHIKKGLYFNFICISYKSTVEMINNAEFECLKLKNPFKYSSILHL